MIAEEITSLEDLMLENALQFGLNPEAIQMSWEKLKDWAGAIAGILLIAVGVIGLTWCPSKVGIRLSEAIFIAGVITLAVDPFLKRRLLKEASKDIFHHLLGFDLPLEVRETLRDFLLKNRSYRRNTEITATVNTIRPDRVKLILDLRSEVVAVTKTEYQQHFSSEESEHAELLQASVTSLSHPKKSYSIPKPTLTPNGTEPMVFEWSGTKVSLSKGEKLNSFLNFTIEKPIEDFFVLNFGASTIHPRLRVSTTSDLEVTASKPDQKNGEEYIYAKVFVEGDHIQIRWKPKSKG